MRMGRAVIVVSIWLSLAASVSAHHGGGTFDGTKEIKLTGTFTRLDLVNPHSWIYFDVARPDGKVDSYRCEMRSATVLRRSGWRPEMFKKGERLTFEGSPDRNDPRSCYLNTIVFEDGKRVDRYGQLTKGPAVVAKRAPRRPTGEPNISGDWAPEQLVMTDPRGRRGALVPLSRVNEYKPGEGRIGGPPGARGAGRDNAPRVIQGAQLTAEGEKGAEQFAVLFSKNNPRMRCETTSILFDWTFDGPVNRITQNKDTIVIEYGQLNLKRTVFMNMKQHPANVKLTRAGHSIGRWEGDTLVIDTVGFLPGFLSFPTRHGSQLHVTERFTLDPKTWQLKRTWELEDPEYLIGKASSNNEVPVLPADAPYAEDKCKEQQFLDYSKATAKK
jgi:hypothetical protein